MRSLLLLFVALAIAASAASAAQTPTTAPAGDLVVATFEADAGLRPANLTVVESSDAASDSFAFGRTAEVLDESSGKVNKWTLVGSTESNLSEGKLSIESPVGRALRDKSIGETVTVDTPRGEKTYRVEKLVE